MALARSPGSRAEPRSQAQRTRRRGFDEQREAFLRSEEAATARLGGIFRQMRQEVEAFLKSGDASSSDEAFYAALLSQADAALLKLGGLSKAWITEWMPKGFVAGAELQAQALELLPVHDQALRFLTGYTLDLIQDTSEGVRRTIQQEIGQATAGSISRPELAERLVASGLTEGPWRDVETRAMVIARTEQMRAYNAGNIAGIRSNGAVAGEWITSRDERVCYICGPRNGQAYILPGVSREEATAAGAPSTWPSLEPVTARGSGSAPPAHPRCRCTLRARYRDDSGQILGTPQSLAGTAPPPAAPVEAAGVDTTQPVNAVAPVSRIDALRIEQLYDLELDAFRTPEEDDALRAYWRGVPAADLARAIRTGSVPGVIDPTEEVFAEIDPGTFAKILQLRTDVKVTYGAGMSSRMLPEHMATIVEAFDVYAQRGFGWEAWAQPSLRQIRIASIMPPHPLGGSGSVAPAFYDGDRQEIVIGPDGLDNVTRTYTAADWTGRHDLVDHAFRATMTHELGHALEARLFGEEVYGRWDPSRAFRELPMVGLPDALNDWLEIWGQGATDIGRLNREIAAAYQGRNDSSAQKAQWQARLGVPEGSTSEERELWRKRAEYKIAEHEELIRRYQEQINRLESMLAKAVEGETASTPYGRNNQAEDFADSVLIFLQNPDRLRTERPKRYAYMSRIFGRQS
jgi:hypothetical protein